MIPLPCEKSGYGALRSRRRLMIAGIGREIQSRGFDPRVVVDPSKDRRFAFTPDR